MKHFRDTFEENYKAVQEPWNNKRGFRIRYVYIGPWYVWNTSPERLHTAKRLIALACVFGCLLYALGAVADSPLNWSRSVALPGTLSLAALVYEVFGVVQFCAAGEKMPNMDFDDIRRKVLAGSLLHALLLVWAALAAVVSLLAAPTLADAVVPGCFFLSSLLSGLIFAYYRSLPYRKEKNEDAGIGLGEKT